MSALPPPHPERLALVGGTLIDGTGRPPVVDSAVLIEGGRIVAAGPREAVPLLAAGPPGPGGPGLRRLDVSGRTILPGLIDCHVHLAPWGLNLLGHQDKPLMLLASEGAHALRTTLEAGVTTARDLGGLDAGFREGVARGLVPGPRLQVSLVIVSPTNGMADATTAQGMPTPYLPGMPHPECNGPYATRAKVREVLRAGADVVKIAVSGGVSAPRLQPRRPIFTPEEIEAIVDEAHMAGAPVVCHALGGPNLLAAVRAGVDTIEHGVWLDEAVADEMAARGTWYVPTFAIYRWHAELGTPERQARARALMEDHRRSFDLARRAGVRIAMGTDSGAYGHGRNAVELGLMVAAGLTPHEAILAATGRAARCLGLADRLGTVEPGREADLLVVEGDPLQDVGLLARPERLALVMQAGVALAGPLRARLGAEPPA